MRGDGERPPAALLDSPTGPHAPSWTWDVRCWACRTFLGRIIYGEGRHGRGVYDRTMLLPELVERPGRDRATGWPRYGLRNRARLRGAPDTAGLGSLRGVKLPEAKFSVLKVPIIVYCPNRPCGRRQTIDPEAEWGMPPDLPTDSAARGPRPTLAEYVAVRAARLKQALDAPALRAVPAQKKPRPLVDQVRAAARAARAAALAADPVKRALQDYRRREWQQERAEMEAEYALERWNEAGRPRMDPEPPPRRGNVPTR